MADVSKSEEVASMKSFCSVFVLVLVMVRFLPGSMIGAEEYRSLKVAEALICKDVVNRTPVDAGTSFAASLGELFCFTRITAAQNPTTITHVWYFGDTERARAGLAVGSVQKEFSFMGLDHGIWTCWAHKVSCSKL
jgi:hypothetical protein